jgi:hypothetical protein
MVGFSHAESEVLHENQLRRLKDKFFEKSNQYELNLVK